MQVSTIYEKEKVCATSIDCSTPVGSIRSLMGIIVANFFDLPSS